MSTPKQIINAISHRPWPLPVQSWSYYQEWNNALFLHWRVSKELLQPLIPKGTTLDIFEDTAWVSIVAFTMEKIRPAGLPALSMISTFHEINVRTYVTSGSKAGVYFLNIEGGKPLSVWTARFLSGLPYENALMQRRSSMPDHHYFSINNKKRFQLEASFSIGEPVAQKTPLDIFFTEKYCLYLNVAQRLYRYDIHHLPWNLYKIEAIRLQSQYNIAGISLSDPPDLMHYSEGVKVLAWKREQVL